MTSEQRLRFKKRFNVAEMKRPILKPVSSKNHATVSAVSIKSEDSGIIYPPLPMPNPIFNNAEKYVYSYPDSIKSSLVNGYKSCSLIVAPSSNPDSPHVS